MGKQWERKGDPRSFSEGPNGEDIAAGWAYTLARGAEQRDVHVELTSSAALATHLLEECRRAMHSDGWTAVIPHLGDDEPPTRIVISRTGVGPAE
jgi:hypothetical protein